MTLSETTNSSLITIGYGNRKAEEFVALLKAHDVKFLGDLRTRPYSKYNPDFSKDRLESFLARHGIKYVYLGDTLGGQPSDQSCYTDGYVDYAKVQERDFFKAGISRLKLAHEQGVVLALMCSEGKPHECHRSKLIGEALRKDQIGLRHIDENGRLITHEDVISKLRGGQTSLFGTEVFTSRKRYVPSEGSNV